MNIRMTLVVVGALTVAVGGCARPEGVRSLLGERLVAPALDVAQRARLESDLAAAEAAYRAAPRDEEAIIWYGRRLAYLYRYEEAIEVYTRGLRVHPDSFRLLRHRGHRYITTRRFDKAVADLSRAAALCEGLPDEVEPDGAPNRFNMPRSTTQSNIWYHLGLAQYLNGDFEAAAASYGRCLELSAVNDDMLCATAHWAYMTLRRLSREEQAAAVLGRIRADMEILENEAYHRLLLMYKGEIGPDDLLDPNEPDPIQLASAGYGVGNWKLCNGDEAGARRIFERIVAGPGWPAFGFIAAEAELARAGP